jgi:hypothetical protein
MDLRLNNAHRHFIGILRPGKARNSVNAGQNHSEMNTHSAKPAEMSPAQAAGNGAERRREHRIATNGTAWMQVLNPPLDEHLEVRILDVSKHGVRLSGTACLCRGTLLRLNMHGLIIFGEVRYCVQVGKDFQAGVQLDDVLPLPIGEAPPTWNLTQMLSPAKRTGE